MNVSSASDIQRKHRGAARLPRRGERGFSLIELLVVLSVALIGLTGALMLTLSLKKGNQGAARGVEARAVGKRVLEELRALTVDEINAFPAVVAAGVAVPAFGDPDLSVQIAPVMGRAGQEYRRRITLIALDPDLLLMRVDVEWTDDGAAQGGQYDHSIPFEVIRDRNEVL